jgi:hypothetical protein
MNKISNKHKQLAGNTWCKHPRKWGKQQTSGALRRWLSSDFKYPSQGRRDTECRRARRARQFGRHVGS